MSHELQHCLTSFTHLQKSLDNCIRIMSKCLGRNWDYSVYKKANILLVTVKQVRKERLIASEELGKPQLVSRG